MKRTISLLLALILVCFPGCQKKSERADYSHSTDTIVTNTSDSKDKTEVTDNTEETGKAEETVKEEEDDQANGANDENTETTFEEPSTTKHTHSYTHTVKPATCNTKGYTVHTCTCGNSYRDSYTPMTYAHNFVKGIKYVGETYFHTSLCEMCGTVAFSSGNADGSIAGGNDKVKYYVTGTVTVGDRSLVEGDYHIVIYGEGAMPELEFRESIGSASEPLWSDYLYDAKKITIADGITSISTGSFYSTDIANDVVFEMADSVKTIKRDSIYINGGTLQLGSGVEQVENIGCGDAMFSVYIPKSVRFFGDWRRPYNATYYYGGTKAELLAIKTYGANYCETIDVKTLLDRYYSEDSVTSLRFCAYLNCPSAGVTDEYFDIKKEWK